MAIADIQCQLINIITQKKDIYRLIYSVLYLCIIIMICTIPMSFPIFPITSIYITSR